MGQELPPTTALLATRHKVVTAVEGITIFALIVGPVSSVIVAQEMQKRAALRNQRLALFTTLLSTRTDRISADHYRSLSLIDVVFARHPRVRQKWASYFEALANPAFNSENGGVIRLTKFNDMLAEMARTLGYGREIGFEEISRLYIPQGVADNNALQQTAQTELIRVLRNSESMGTARKDAKPNAVGLRIEPREILAFAIGSLAALIPTYLRSNGRPSQPPRELPSPRETPKT